MSLAGVNMHDARVHTKKILARGQDGWKPNPKARAERKNFPSSSLETRRRKYRETRDRFYAMGLDAKGNPFKSELGKRISLSQLAGPPRNRTWTPERTARFKATMLRLQREKARQKLHHTPNSSKRIQFVYPIPGEDKPEPTPKPTATTSAIKFCPHCGTNIERYL